MHLSMTVYPVTSDSIHRKAWRVSENQRLFLDCVEIGRPVQPI
jgi:hypothetical protein